MDLYRLSLGEVYQRVKGSPAGLKKEEAEARLQGGRNVLKEGKKKSKLGLFFSQFKDLMTLILIAAAALSGTLAFLTGDESELVDTGILLFIILLNAIVGFLQQYRADAAIENLKKLTVSTSKAVRSGQLKTVDAEELVVGDVIELAEGDRVPADCRIIQSDDFRCDESTLTGESVPVKKCDCIVNDPALAARKNTAHMGTFCVKGRARCIVTATGMDTEAGKIADLLRRTEQVPSPLDRTIARLGKIVTAAVFAVAAVLFVGGLLLGRASFLDNVMNAVAIAVAAIPEGMGAVVTVILAMGVRRMAKRGAAMRKLSAVEALGSCSVICSDKTGTLTKNRMTVEEIATDFSRSSERYTGTAAQKELLCCMRVCHTVKGEAGGYIGDPTEIALLEFCDRQGFSFSAKTLSTLPFSSEARRMSVRTDKGQFIKGGTEVILPLCRHILSESGKRPLTNEDVTSIQRRLNELSSRAMRVLAFCEGEEGDAVFLGLAAMLDPPKEGVKEAVEQCRRAGVRTVMITGDSPETALAIATRLGIAEKRSEVITGAEIDEMGEKYLASAEKYSVYARVSPRHKQKIVKALQENGEVAAMTGDGVNDAPALRAADIGIAMGSGTDVTKNAADMVLTDDSFPTMVCAVEEGRNVFFNVKKTVSFFLSTNLAEVLCVLVMSLFLWRYDFLTSTQLLWINLITDSLPVLALGVERTEGALERPPVSDKEIFSKASVLRMIFFGVLQAGLVIGIFLFGLPRWGQGGAVTAAFFTMSFAELLHAFNVRGEDGRRRFGDFFSNRALLLTAAAGIGLNLLIGLAPPLRAMFDLSPLSPFAWLCVFAASALVLPAGAAWNFLSRARGRVRLSATRKKQAAPVPRCPAAPSSHASSGRRRARRGRVKT